MVGTIDVGIIGVMVGIVLTGTNVGGFVIGTNVGDLVVGATVGCFVFGGNVGTESSSGAGAMVGACVCACVCFETTSSSNNGKDQQEPFIEENMPLLILSDSQSNQQRANPFFFLPWSWGNKYMKQSRNHLKTKSKIVHQ